MPLGPFAAATDASPAIRHAGTLLKSGARQSLIVLVLSLFTPTTPAHAAQFTVINLNDSGAGSLRQAITDANAAATADTITFSVSGTITLTSTLPAITDAAGLTINGGGQVLTISGNNAVRVMQVDPGKSLTLHRVTIANGNAVGSSGGGIDNQGTLTITNSTFSGNSAAGVGGGIYNGGNGTLTITNSTFSGNSAADIGLSGTGGGGIYNARTFTITNSTFSGNSTLSVGGGGGIHNIANPFGSSTITNSTFSGNSAPNGSGGGILNDGAVTAVTLRNTIVANSDGGNCGGPITNGGNNIDSGTTCGWGAVSGSMSSTNPLLGALANNFAETQTFALLTGSPAIDGVTFSPPNSAPSTDQRGVARPQGGGYDIGAFEVVPGAVFIVNTSADTDDFFCNVLGEGSGNQDCTLREAIDAANALFGPDTITFSVSGTITLASMLPTIDDGTGMLTIDGTGQTLIISGNNAVRVMQVSGGASLTLNNVTIADGASDIGGGVLNLGSVTITNSTFSGNNAGNGSGGGIYNIGTLTIINSTFSGNSASPFGGGGGIYAGGTLTITNSTFSGNSAIASGGGGIYASGTVTLRNTIVANSVSGGNCGGTIINGGNNIDDGVTCGWGAVSGSMSSTIPLLATLANNGGPTQTFALLTSSPAIDGVTVSAPNSAPSTDQRGVARPQGVRYDIGAFEGSETQAGPAFIVNVSADTNDGFCDILGQGIGNHDCTLQEAINAANALAGANTVTFSVTGTIVLGSRLPNITDAAGLTMDGTGQTLTISGNNAVRVMQVAAGASLTLNKVTIANGSALIGGGIWNDAGTLTITNSTVSGNSTSASGGGIYNEGGGTVTITNSTVSGNSTSGGLGGGVFNNDGGTLTITNSTFSGNSAPNGAGAGIFNDELVTGVILRNTIVANSVGGNCGGTITNGGNNIDDGTTCGWGALSGSMSNTNPLLGALANNGGPTPTFALLTGSPAIDGVTFSPPNSAPSTDQRGVARPKLVRYDIGAFESEAQAGPAFIVNVSVDTNDGFCDLPGQGIGNHDCTLREAINAANALAGANTITFSVSGTITLASTLPTITDTAGLTMNGPGQTLTISGNNAVRVMQVVAGASLTLNNLTIANGIAPVSSGGGIYNSGTATITNSTFSGNSATSGTGGAINNGDGGTLTITNSTFSGNSANSGSGGGVFNNGGPVTITNSTFSGNSATSGSAAAIRNNSVAAQMTLRNTIVANSVGAGNCFGGFTNGGNNVDDGTTCGWGAVSGSKSSTNPLLGALANNGGPTPTFALLTGSPAIDGVTFNPPNSAPSTDQRGVARPQGVRYDIGAFEGSETQAGPAFIVNVSADTNDGLCDILGQGIGNKDCTLREAINAANALAGANTITFSVSGTITLVGSPLPSITDAAGLTMNGTGQTLTISGNNAVRVMQVGAGASLTLNNLTIANGIAAGDNGGGIYNSGTLTITNSTFSGNSANFGFGGAINNGGGGTVTITNSTFSGNSANSGFGAGVYNSGTLTITNSTFSGNSAASGQGAVIYRNGGTATLRNTIVANSVGAGNCGGAITNGGNNIDDGATCGWGAVSGSMSSTNPLLGALANNGGPTQTFALLTGSPAIDGVTFNAPNSAPSTDQRGFARPRGVRYDIGSYERGFTDDPLTAGTTTVKAVHITELRIRIDAVRIAKGLLAYEWADPSLGPNAWLIRAQHIIDLRTALHEAYLQAGRMPPTYATDPPPSLAPGVVVKAAHIAEIRAALLAIE